MKAQARSFSDSSSARDFAHSQDTMKAAICLGVLSEGRTKDRIEPYSNYHLWEIKEIAKEELSY